MKDAMKQEPKNRGSDRCNSCANCPGAAASADIEWARISDRQAVVATADQMWIHELDQDGAQDPFAEPMCGPGSIATTRQLLDAAWCAGFMAAGARPVPRKTLPGYVWELIGYYHSTSNTPK